MSVIVSPTKGEIYTKNFNHKKILRAAIAALCMVSMLLYSNPFFIREAKASGIQFVILSDYSKTMNIGDEFYLLAIATNGKKPSFSSSKSKVASINTYGLVTAKSAGTAKITAKVKNGEASCKITVKKTTVKLSKTKLTLYRKGTEKLTVTASTNNEIKWRSNKSSVAKVDEEGNVTAIKHGTATITATIDGVSKTCEVTVKQPTVSLEQAELTLPPGKTGYIRAKVSSGNEPEYKSSNTSVAVVDENGLITAKSEGRAYIYAIEDGIKTKMTVYVRAEEKTKKTNKKS